MRLWPAAFVLVLLSACGRTESYNAKPPCVRNPEGTPNLTLQTANGMPRVWSKDKCIPVTYSPSLAKDLKPTLERALKAWQIECTGVCFEPLTEAKEGPTTDFDRRLHVHDITTGVPTAWELLNDGRTGQTLHATIYATTLSTQGDLMKQIGFVLGFEGSKEHRDTVLEEDYPSMRTELGSLDRQSVCAVYPSCR